MRNGSYCIMAVALLFALFFIPPNVCLSSDRDSDHLTKAQIEALVGPDALVSPVLRERLLTEPENTETYEDFDGDGDPDVVTYIDEAARHSDERRPMLFRVLDDDEV